MRARVQVVMHKIWKAPIKGGKNNIEAVMLCSKTKGNFLMQLSKDLVSKEPIFKDSFILRIEMTASVSRPETNVDFKGGNPFGYFAVTKEWCASAYFVIKSFIQKGMMREPSLDLEDLKFTTAV